MAERRLRRPVIAANWKMNHGPTEARTFMARYLARHAPRQDATIALFPPALTLATVRDALGDRTDILLGVQNIWTHERGAFTGENSAVIARDAGASLCLVGHSERRHVFGETDAQTAEKCAAAFRAGLLPMLCVGERIDERERGETEAVVLRQLEAGLSALPGDATTKVLVAYEPVWAIGTGRTATPEDAATVHAVIRRDLAARVGPRAVEIPILYGGSVTAANASALLAAPEVDGLLVGGASLDPEGWASICGT